MDQHFFNDSSGYETGDFVFGLAAINLEPFTGKEVYTLIGKVTKIQGTKVFVKSDLLDRKNTSVKIVLK